jgi:hypothetical protein
VVLSAQAPQILELEKNINRPLLVLQKRGTDQGIEGQGGANIRYFIEESPKATILWIANKGEHPVHFNITWIMQDGRPRTETEEGQLIPPTRVHLSALGRMSLLPPKDFKDILLTEIRIGQDEGHFIETNEKGVQIELQKGAK